MTGTPLVSVITPTFNAGHRLERCLASVAAQSYPEIEHIVVDGGSTDGTVDTLRSWPNLRYVSEPDEGQADAINKGFEMARGQVMGWLNADDILMPETVRATVDALQREGTGWTIGDVVVVTGSEGELERPTRPEVPRTWRARNVAAQPGSFMTRWALERVGFLDPSFHYMMDLDLWIRLIDAGIKHSYIPEVLAVFEVHGDSKSGSIPHSHFLVDDARARYKSGRVDDAAFAFGRAIAWETEASHKTEAETSLGDLFGPGRGSLDPGGVRAGFRTERAILALKKGSFRGAVRLTDPLIWKHQGARARVRHFIGRALSHRRRSITGSHAAKLLANAP